ncbi:hypothetical protein CAC42_7193 [Sphaceloma murrayae]|uniref:Uncharacterized protein n=1 Tax=Sphaceloma murrayae TaxID=2082308 RepID=A0A2K1QQ91_9PEZI|nr:hypothetical protein CAC42_7193 [Sphaceloma murrayae]
MDDPTPALLLLSLPPSSLCGIDLLSFTTSPSFRGVKSLPPGPHFIFTSPHSTLAVRHGAWFLIPDLVSGPGPGPDPSPTLILKRWDEPTETLQPVLDAAETLRARANLGAIWRGGMAPYRQSSGSGSGSGSGSDGPADQGPNSWVGLTAEVTREYLSRVFGTGEEGWHVTTYSDVEDGADGLGGVVQGTERALRLMAVDLRRTWREGATGRERTEGARDRSWYLFHLAGGSGGEGSGHGSEGALRVVLAEFEFCFVMALTLNNFACLEQWRKLMRVVLTCRVVVAEVPGFFVRFLELVRGQMLRLGTDVTVPTEEGNQGDERHGGKVLGEVRESSLEDKTEEELLRYDLPLRGKTGRGEGRKQALKREVRAMEKEAEMEREKEVLHDMGEDELKTLFLEDELDVSGHSFLRGLLVRFREAVEELVGSRDDMEIEGRQQAYDKTVVDVLDELKKLEATLFDMYSWDFDDALLPERPFRKAMPEFGGDPSGAHLKSHHSTAEGEDVRPMGLSQMDDDEEDEDGEYAPAVVDLTQEQMDALGIQGTPGSKVKTTSQESRKAKEERQAELSQVVVEDSSEDEEGGQTQDYSDNDFDDTIDIEDLDVRY